MFITPISTPMMVSGEVYISHFDMKALFSILNFYVVILCTPSQVIIKRSLKSHGRREIEVQFSLKGATLVYWYLLAGRLWVAQLLIIMRGRMHSLLIHPWSLVKIFEYFALLLHFNVCYIHVCVLADIFHSHTLCI